MNDAQTLENTQGAVSPVRSDDLFAPCPFCGRSVGYISSHDGYRVACDPCDIYGPRGADYEDARRRWNERANTILDRTSEGVRT